MAFLRRHIIIITLSAIALVASLLIAHDNIDHSMHSIRYGHDAETELHMLSTRSAKHNEMMKSLHKEHEEKVKRIKESIKEISKTNKNKCLKDPSTVGHPKEQLQSFVEGDCAPVIILPGLMASRLLVEVDCNELQANHPEIMAACGWTTCSWSLLGRRPDTEYLMWIPGMLSPMAFLTISNETCFGYLIQAKYNATHENPEGRYVYPRGIKFNWYGNTEKTLMHSDNGFSAISNLLPLPIQVASSMGFAGMDTYYTALGYQKGLSLFAIPYDFRQTHIANAVSYTLERTIRYAYELTGKKVVVVAHSLGNLNTLPVLAGMKQEDKDKMISTYVAMAPPLGGATKSVRLSLGGDDEFVYLPKVFGMDFYNQRAMIGASSSTQDLIPKDAFFRFRNEPWMKDLLKRIELEAKFDPTTEKGQEYWKSVDSQKLPYSFFPKSSETCFDGFTGRPKQCMTGITDLGTNPIAVVKNESYYANFTSIKTLFQRHFTMDDLSSIDHMMNDSLASGVYLFPNPNVPVVYIYGTHVPTELSSEWDYSPEEKTSNEQYAFPSRTLNKYGDGTVEVSYSLPIAMKWAWEHINNKTNAKPVKIAEYCSTYNQKKTVWEGQDSNGTNTFNTTEYIGTNCICLDKENPGEGDDCFHAGITSDIYIVDFIGTIANTKEKVADKNSTGAFKLTNNQIVKLRDSSPHLKNPRKDRDVRKWLYPDENGKN